ncbi:M1 family aminopeptidase [Chitinophaga lutea]
MKALYLFDLRRYTRAWTSLLTAAALLGLGLFAGYRANFSAGEGVLINSPYTAGYLLGMLSLSIIFIATAFGAKLLFQEWDTKFDLILQSMPIPRRAFQRARFGALFTLTLAGFLLIAAGFALGQQGRTGSLHIVRYLYPFFLFGVVNSLLACSVLSLLAWRSKNKLLMAIGGLLLYVLYMVLLVYSGSPLMAQSMPQSIFMQKIAAIADPFGLSGYFYVSRDFSVAQRNTMLVPVAGYFLLNRLLVVGVALICFWGGSSGALTARRPSRKTRVQGAPAAAWPLGSLRTAATAPFTIGSELQAIGSYVRMDIRLTFKSIPFAAGGLLLLFLLGMEMYAEIGKGIRLPQQYASSGLMATTIIENLHLPGMLLIVYFTHDLCWKNRQSGMYNIEQTTPRSSARQIALVCSLSAIVIVYTLSAILLGLAFQAMYGFLQIDWPAYGGVFLFNAGPMLLLACTLILVNRAVSRSGPALALSIVAALALASPLAGQWIPIPLLRFFSGFNGTYSDFAGYGPYPAAFALRLLCGAGIIALLYLLTARKFSSWMVPLLLVVIVSGTAFMRGYAPHSTDDQNAAAVAYEKNFRVFQRMPQPTITDVRTQIDLYGSRRAYVVTGRYTLVNQTPAPIQRILLNFGEDCRLDSAVFNDSIRISAHEHILELPNPMRPGDSAHLDFRFSYQWQPVNGHQPFNAIIENGAFMRISRYYPQIGYQPDRELADTLLRQRHGLGPATKTLPLEAPKTDTKDFITLDMTVSAEAGQTAVGTGELVSHWKNGSRQYFRFNPGQPIPFRFAVSSAAYRTFQAQHDGIQITVLYQPSHFQNVAHLVHCARQTLDYCRHNFGPYPFRSITFAEVSAFTRGFAATAYPAVIYMPENMLFHANIAADQRQDVINELAGHELSHLWWGNSQISPDDREGAQVLTETLAMYTEMMLYKKMYGREKMMERVRMHQGIYDAEKGMMAEEPLYKATTGHTHIYYSKGAVAMVALSDLIGEDKVNTALRQFLEQNRYPHPRPATNDLIETFLRVSEPRFHAAIKRLFTEV